MIPLHPYLCPSMQADLLPHIDHPCPRVHQTHDIIRDKPGRERGTRAKTEVRGKRSLLSSFGHQADGDSRAPPPPL